MSEKSRLLKNTGLIAIGNFGAKMVSFLLLPLYTSILNTSEYGTYDFILAVGAFLIPVVTLSLHEAMFRFIIEKGKDEKSFDEIISNAFYVVVACLIIFVFVMVGIQAVFSNLGNIMYICFYVFVSSVYVFFNNMLRGLGKIKEYAIVSSGKNILQLVFNVVAIVGFRWGMEGLLFSTCAAEFLAFSIVICCFRLWRHISIRLVSWNKIKPMILYSYPLIANSLSSQIINLSDRLVISSTIGSEPNGIYSVSYKFPNILDTVYHFFYTAWSESASRVMNKGKEEANRYYQALHKNVDNFIFACILTMTASMPLLFRIFIRGDYIQGFDYVPLLMFAMYFSCMANFYSGIFTAFKQTKILATSTTIAAIVNLTVCIIGISRYGLYAAAASTLIADVVLLYIRKILVRKYVVIKTSILSLLFKGIMIFVVMLLYDYNNILKISASMTCAIVYSIIVNREIIIAIIRKMIRKNRK